MKACINGNWIAYDDIGEGPAVILIHSFPLCRQMWQPQLEALSKHGFRVIAPDLPGFGESVSGEEPFTLTSLTDAVCGLMGYLGLGRAVMVGISVAGGLLLDMLERYPQRVAATCFLSPAMQPGDAAEQVRRLDLAELVREGHRTTAIDNLCEHFLSGQTEPTKLDLTSKLRDWMKASCPVAMAGALASQPLRLSYCDENQPYPVPTLIMTGACDRVMPLPRQSGPSSGLRKVINDAGHLLNLEAPAEVNRHLIGFLQNLNTIKLHHYRLQKVA